MPGRTGTPGPRSWNRCLLVPSLVDNSVCLPWNIANTSGKTIAVGITAFLPNRAEERQDAGQQAEERASASKF